MSRQSRSKLHKASAGFMIFQSLFRRKAGLAGRILSRLTAMYRDSCTMSDATLIPAIASKKTDAALKTKTSNAHIRAIVSIAHMRRTNARR